jgi:hypothetical protein
MPSSAVALTPDGSLLVGDTISGSLDLGWLSFQCNFPRHVPMSAATVHDAHDVVRRAAPRHIRWVSGDFDHLT